MPVDNRAGCCEGCGNLFEDKDANYCITKEVSYWAIDKSKECGEWTPEIFVVVRASADAGDGAKSLDVRTVTAGTTVSEIMAWGCEGGSKSEVTVKRAQKF